MFCFNACFLDTSRKAMYKLNKIVNKFLLAGDKFMPQIHLKQPGFTCSACGPFTKNKERIQKFKETGDNTYTKIIHILTLKKKSMIKVLNLKLVIM